MEDTLSEMATYSGLVMLPAYTILTDERGFGIDAELLRKLGDFLITASNKNDPRRTVNDFLTRTAQCAGAFNSN